MLAEAVILERPTGALPIDVVAFAGEFDAIVVCSRHPRQHPIRIEGQDQHLAGAMIRLATREHLLAGQGAHGGGIEAEGGGHEAANVMSWWNDSPPMVDLRP